MLTLWRHNFFIKLSMTSKVIQGHKQWPFYLKIHFFFCLCYWLIGTNAAEHYERTKFDLYKDDICFNLILTLMYVLMDNFLSLFSLYPEKNTLLETVSGIKKVTTPSGIKHV